MKQNGITKKDLLAIEKFYKNYGLFRKFEDNVFSNHFWFEDISFKEEEMVIDGFNVYHYFDNFETYAVKNDQVVLFNETKVIEELKKYNQVKKLPTNRQE